MRISDWSSDVCSSYLIGHIPALTLDFGLIAVELEQVRTDTAQHALDQLRLIIHEQGDDAHQRRHGAADGVGGKIGRASCRERGCQYVEISVVAVSLKKKNTQKRNKQERK